MCARNWKKNLPGVDSINDKLVALVVFVLCYFSNLYRVTSVLFSAPMYDNDRATFPFREGYVFDFGLGFSSVSYQQHRGSMTVTEQLFHSGEGYVLISGLVSVSVSYPQPHGYVLILGGAGLMSGVSVILFVFRI